ncbi:helix-turn-helix domain-containing protein [Streptomyces caniferus]|uniref:helix-turn-helix domain-containing protein n=1 Tax=Streptomyces caniferus TaxID=285557 RepID=UPI002E2B46E4|nr:helix-turn-helix domain-containing protein [Streptomyces caniferus]
MQINRTAHAANFTVMSNGVLRDRRLSFTARGILGHLLSLPDGAREDVRTLADRNPGVGRRGVANAVQELVDAGYYVRRNVRDPETGRVRTETFVFDTPQTDASPLPASPGTGTPAVGNAGTLPSGVKDLVSKTPANPSPSPAVEAAPAPVAPVVREGDLKDSHGPHRTEAARILARLVSVDGRLKLSDRAVQELVPLAAQWLENGATVTDLTDAVVQGLPVKVYSASKLVADRLTRKLPAPRRAWSEFADCGTCRNPLPAGQSSGICATCAGVVPHPDLVALAANSTPDPTVQAHAAGIRAALRARRVAA